MSLIVNYFAGPGAGKSTTAAVTFAELKKREVNVELVTEYAKDITWEERWNALACQPHVFGEQLFRIERLETKVDVIITDSPIFLSAIYNSKYPESFNRAVKDIFKQKNTLNVFIDRMKPYVQHGRNQTLEEAVQVDKKIQTSLEEEGIPFFMVKGTSEKIVEMVLPDIFRRLGVDFIPT